MPLLANTRKSATAVAMSGPLMELTAREAELRYARPSHYSHPPPSRPAAQFFLSRICRRRRSKLNEQLDRVKEKAVAAASSAVKEQEEKLARLPSSVGASLRASRSGLDEAAAAAADAARQYLEHLRADERFRGAEDAEEAIAHAAACGLD